MVNWRRQNPRTLRKLSFGNADYARVVPLGGYTAYFTLPFRSATGNWFAVHKCTRWQGAGIRPGGPDTTQMMLSFPSPPLGYERPLDPGSLPAKLGRGLE